ncbi:hypothetical protein HK097_005605, partial [Rhizophlyctis rosea]
MVKRTDEEIKKNMQNMQNSEAKKAMEKKELHRAELQRASSFQSSSSYKGRSDVENWRDRAAVVKDGVEEQDGDGKGKKKKKTRKARKGSEGGVSERDGSPGVDALNKVARKGKGGVEKAGEGLAVAESAAVQQIEAKEKDSAAGSERGEDGKGKETPTPLFKDSSLRSSVWKSFENAALPSNVDPAKKPNFFASSDEEEGAPASVVSAVENLVESVEATTPSQLPKPVAEAKPLEEKPPQEDVTSKEPSQQEIIQAPSPSPTPTNNAKTSVTSAAGSAWTLPSTVPTPIRNPVVESIAAPTRAVAYPAQLPAQNAMIPQMYNYAYSVPPNMYSIPAT